jgi:ribonucleoside-diphosphate reductase alpha chain
MLIAMCLFHAESTNRMRLVKDYYDAISTFKISLPTPIMSGVRTPQRQFSSCVLIESADDRNSIFSTAHAIGMYVSEKAGIGIGGGALRPLGSPIRGGDATHTGVIPFYRMWQAAVKSCSQGGVRSGSATLYYPLFHLEIEDLLVLKNNKGTEFNRLRQMDYGVQFNKLFYQRLVSGQDITLLNPNDVPGLYDAFFNDQEKFKELYEKAERNPRLRKKKISAIELFSLFMQERKDTGRIYLMNVDNVNNQGSFQPSIAPIRMSNLCAEITLPTKPIYNIFDKESDAEVALCILSAINIGVIQKNEDFEKVCMLAVRALDNLIDFQSYLLPASERGAINRRTIGIGMVNFAYWLAKNDLNYQDIDAEGLAKIHQMTESFAYYLTKASVDLAEERGPAPWYSQTKYSLGQFPKDVYAKSVDELVDPTLYQDWNTIADRMSKFGIRNSTLMALMPSETSSLVSNSTNGVEPPRALVSVKQSKDGVIKQVVPEIRKLKNKYDLLWDQKSPLGYLKIMAVLQKFVDQAISVNTTYNPKFYPSGELPMSELLQHMLFHYKYGGKTLYYFNTNDGAGELDIDSPKPSIDVLEDDDCETCKI